MLGLVLSIILWETESIPLSLFLGNDQDITHSDDMHLYLHAVLFCVSSPDSTSHHLPLVSKLFYILHLFSEFLVIPHPPPDPNCINLSQFIFHVCYEAGVKVNFFQIDTQLLQYHLLERFLRLGSTNW